MKFSLVIPCYNEAANLPLLLGRCKEVTRYPDIEVILVDNGSTDNSCLVLESLLPQYPGCRSIRVEKNQGYGFGILSGLRAAKGKIIGWTHADMQTDPQDALQGLKLFEKYGNDIFVKGRRYGRPLADIVFTMGMSFFETILLAKPMWDINAQPNIFHRSFFESIKDNCPKDFSLDLYFLYMAKKKKLNIIRFDVMFPDRIYGSSNWNTGIASKWKFIKRTVQFSTKLKKGL